MISKVKDLIAVSAKLDNVSVDVKNVSKDVIEHSKLIESFKEQVELLTGTVKANADQSSKFCTGVQDQISELKNAREDLKQEVYDFKLIKADIKSRLVAELTEDFRSEIRKESEKLEIDVKRFNELKDELSTIVSRFKEVETEISKFKSIAQEVKAADFELARHAKEISKADHEKLQLMQKVDHLERLISKMRRSSR